MKNGGKEIYRDKRKIELNSDAREYAKRSIGIRNNPKIYNKDIKICTEKLMFWWGASEAVVQES